MNCRFCKNEIKNIFVDLISIKLALDENSLVTEIASNGGHLNE